jgi:hypothetical protein
MKLTSREARWRTDTANQRGGSEWEPIKILLEGDGNSNKINAACNTLLQLTTQVGQARVATGVPLDLGTNTQPFDPRTQRNTKPRVYRPTPVRPVSTTCKTPDFHRKPESLYHRDSPWISGYRVQNVSQINTHSHTSHHIKIIVHKIYYKSIMEYINTSLLVESEWKFYATTAIFSEGSPSLFFPPQATRAKRRIP